MGSAPGLSLRAWTSQLTHDAGAAERTRKAGGAAIRKWARQARWQERGSGPGEPADAGALSQLRINGLFCGLPVADLEKIERQERADR